MWITIHGCKISNQQNRDATLDIPDSLGEAAMKPPLPFLFMAYDYRIL